MKSNIKNVPLKEVNKLPYSCEMCSEDVNITFSRPKSNKRHFIELTCKQEHIAHYFVIK